MAKSGKIASHGISGRLAGPSFSISGLVGLKGRCKVIFESDIGWIFLATSGNGGLWLASTILNIQWEARTGESVTLKKDFTTAL